MTDIQHRIKIFNKNSVGVTCYLAPPDQAKTTQILTIPGEGTVEEVVGTQEYDYLLSTSGKLGLVVYTLDWVNPVSSGTARISDISYNTLSKNGSIGMSANRLAPGDHTHDGVYVKASDLTDKLVVAPFTDVNSTKVLPAGIYSSLKGGALIGAYYRAINIPDSIADITLFSAVRVLDADGFVIWPGDVYADVALRRLIVFFNTTFTDPVNITVSYS